MAMNRRQFLSLGAFASSALFSPLPDFALPIEQPGSFDFIFFTDTHIKPELGAPEGCAMCFKKIRSLKADFAIQGGDHVFDALGTDRQQASSLYYLYTKTEQNLGLPIHHTIGNHDAFGVYAKSGIALGDAGYGKRMFEDRFGATYYSFDHKGYHFVVLDSIEPTQDRNWEARINAHQLSWLQRDLESLSAETPVIIVVHVPLVTGAAGYAPPRLGKENQLSVMNAHEVLPLFQGRNILAVLQGHLHINEVVKFREIPYITGGAVCGNWWHGARWGTPEGFTVVSLHGGKIDWRYETYGFKSVDPQDT
jgi:Icc protein